MYRRLLLLLIALIWLLSLTGCQGLPGSTPQKVELVGDYTYSDGEALFTVRPGFSSPLIVYRNKWVVADRPAVTLGLADLSIDTPASDALDKILPFDGPLTPPAVTRWQESRLLLPAVYAINSVTVQEFVEGKWETYSEFDPSSPPSVASQIGIALVVDTSDSIDRQRALARGMVTSMVRRVQQRWPANAWISVIPLGSAGQSHQFTRDRTQIEASLAAVADVRYTALYDAIEEACDSFATFEQARSAIDPAFHFDRKWILLFTDGQDNYSAQSLESLREPLATAGVQVYAFGIEALDGLDSDALRTLASDRMLEFSGLPYEERAAREQAAIERIAAQTPLLYDVTYVRNDQPITAPRRIKLIFEVEKLGN